MTEIPRLAVRDGAVIYTSPGGARFRALERISFEVWPGETLGIVGESGCGKSSLAKLIVRLTPRYEGQVHLDGKRIDNLGHNAWRTLRRRIQYIFQDPLGSLDPRMPVLAQVREPLDIHGIGKSEERNQKAAEILDAVGVGQHLWRNAPVELSGGQRQRVGIARALILEPEVLLCDEPISALDVSIQAQILTLLMDLRNKLGLTMLLISHDLAVIRHISHRVVVIYLGRMVEVGGVDELFSRPAHPYTRALLDAAPRISGGQNQGRRTRLKGETPPHDRRPRGCAFAERCAAALDRCRRDDPELRPLEGGRAVACHFPFSLEAS